MILWHWTPKDNLDSILQTGLKPNKIGIVYLTPRPQLVKDMMEQWHQTETILLEIDTKELRLTTFDDCNEWEILCWGSVPPQDIRLTDKNTEGYPIGFIPISTERKQCFLQFP